MSLSLGRKKNNGKTDWLATAGITLMLTAAVLMIWFFVHGETMVVSTGSDEETLMSMNCVANGVKYPLATYDGSVNKKITVNAIFDNSKVKSISLVYLLEYDDTTKPEKSRNINHAAMNGEFGKSNLGADALNVNYTNDSQTFRMSLYASGDAYNANTARFFMLNEAFDAEKALRTAYENQGFECVVKN